MPKSVFEGRLAHFLKKKVDIKLRFDWEIKKPHSDVRLINTGGRGQNRTADTRIFNFKNHHLYIVLGPPSLVKTR